MGSSQKWSLGSTFQVFTGTIFSNRETTSSGVTRARFAKDGKAVEDDPVTEIELEDKQDFLCSLRQDGLQPLF